MSNGDPFQEIEISSFEEFELKYLNIRNNRRIFHTFFRGQSEAIWGLVPSIFRNFEEDEIPVESIKNAIVSEFAKVAWFVENADRIGFDLPGELLEFLNTDNFDINDPKNFHYWYYQPSNTWIELMTIAQHYGVQTRYLDFTFNPFTALYFAAEDVVKKLLNEKDKVTFSDDNFSLWMLDRFNLRNMPGKSNRNIQYFQVPTARNRYLNAQKGLFLTPPLPELKEKLKTVNKNIFNIAEVIKTNNIERVGEGEEGLRRRWPTIYKFNFPFRIAPLVLKEIDEKHNINLSTLKPNLEHIMPYEKLRLKVYNLAYELRNKK